MRCESQISRKSLESHRTLVSQFIFFACTVKMKKILRTSQHHFAKKVLKQGSNKRVVFSKMGVDYGSPNFSVRRRHQQLKSTLEAYFTLEIHIKINQDRDALLVTIFPHTDRYPLVG